jgi:uncharacterized protein involved in exopolysaccharide biosynthesis
MNDSTPFDTVGDAPEEARIVAWVLGEASTFEVAELERLCEERPELLVFRHRMRALHGLLTEAEAKEPDLSWKLSPEKRRILDEIFGEENAIPISSKNEIHPHHGRRALLAIAACLVISLVIYQIIPKDYEAEAIIEIKPPVSEMSPFDGRGSHATQPMTAQFFGTEFEKIKSHQALGKVVANLDLTKRWGVDEKSAIAKLKDRITTQNVRGTDLVSIRVSDRNEADAKDITHEVVQSYKEYRNSLEQQDTERQLAELNKAVQDQEDRVEERRKILATIVRTKGIIYKGQNSFYGSSAVDEDQGARSALQAFNELEQSKMQLESQINSLLKYNSDQLMTYAGGLDLPDNVVKSLLPQYQESKRELERLKAQGLGEDHPTIKTEAEQMARVKSQLDEGVVNLRATLQAQLDLADNRLKSVEVMKDDSREEAIKRGLDAQDYVDAKQDFETDQELLQKLRLQQIGLQVAKKTSDESIVVHEAPARSRAGAFSDSSLALNSSTPASPAVPGQYPVESKGKDQDLGTIEAREQTQLAKQSAHRKAASEPALALQDPALLDVGKGASLSKMEPIAGYQHTKDLEPLFADSSLAEMQAPEEAQKWAGRAMLSPRKSKRDETGNRITLGAVAANPLSMAKIAPYNLAASPLDSSVPANRDLNVADSAPVDAIAKLNGDPETPQEPTSAEETETLVDLLQETPTSETPYSTFSLNISDASFQLAKAALAKGERPDPATIKPEQFYNAVDYGDPAPRNGEPISATIEQAVHPLVPARNLVRIALRTASVGRGAIQPLRLTLLVDQSGSMAREDRRAAMELALSQLGVLLTRNDLVTVIGFSRTSRLLADGMKGDQANQLGNLVNQAASEGGTNLEEAMKLGGTLAARHYLAEAQNRIVLFTDGAANLGDADPARLAAQVKAFRQQGLAFDVAGIGADDLNDRLLSELARNGNGRYYVVGDEAADSFARQLAGAFRPAAENVKVQVNFNPQRVKGFKLIGFEKDRLKTKDFRNDAVDAADLAAEEAGVAIYQVEPIADGTGELGEVSVRFRDAVSREMVERTWTIHHESAAPAFDRTTPSMQLAGLSMLAAEKLRGGALGDAIDFKQFARSTSLVKESYGSSTRVAEMLRIIDSLR